MLRSFGIKFEHSILYRLSAPPKIPVSFISDSSLSSWTRASMAMISSGSRTNRVPSRSTYFSVPFSAPLSFSRYVPLRSSHASKPIGRPVVGNNDVTRRSVQFSWRCTKCDLVDGRARPRPLRRNASPLPVVTSSTGHDALVARPKSFLDRARPPLE